MRIIFSTLLPTDITTKLCHLVEAGRLGAQDELLPVEVLESAGVDQLEQGLLPLLVVRGCCAVRGRRIALGQNVEKLVEEVPGGVEDVVSLGDLGGNSTALKRDRNGDRKSIHKHIYLGRLHWITGQHLTDFSQQNLKTD